MRLSVAALVLLISVLTSRSAFAEECAATKGTYLKHCCGKSPHDRCMPSFLASVFETAEFDTSDTNGWRNGSLELQQLASRWKNDNGIASAVMPGIDPLCPKLYDTLQLRLNSTPGYTVVKAYHDGGNATDIAAHVSDLLASAPCVVAHVVGESSCYGECGGGRGIWLMQMHGDRIMEYPCIENDAGIQERSLRSVNFTCPSGIMVLCSNPATRQSSRMLRRDGVEIPRNYSIAHQGGGLRAAVLVHAMGRALLDSSALGNNVQLEDIVGVSGGAWAIELMADFGGSYGTQPQVFNFVSEVRERTRRYCPLDAILSPSNQIVDIALILSCFDNNWEEMVRHLLFPSDSLIDVKARRAFALSNIASRGVYRRYEVGRFWTSFLDSSGFQNEVSEPSRAYYPNIPTKPYSYYGQVPVLFQRVVPGKQPGKESRRVRWHSTMNITLEITTQPDRNWFQGKTPTITSSSYLHNPTQTRLRVLTASALSFSSADLARFILPPTKDMPLQQRLRSLAAEGFNRLDDIEKISPDMNFPSTASSLSNQRVNMMDGAYVDECGLRLHTMNKILPRAHNIAMNSFAIPGTLTAAQFGGLNRTQVVLERLLEHCTIERSEIHGPINETCTFIGVGNFHVGMYAINLLSEGNVYPVTLVVHFFPVGEQITFQPHLMHEYEHLYSFVHSAVANCSETPPVQAHFRATNHATNHSGYV